MSKFNNVLAILFDIDGTSIHSDFSFSKRLLDILRKYKEKGILLIPCTGRFYKDLPVELIENDLIQYAILCNGAEIYDVHNDKILRNLCIQKETVKEFISLGKENDLMYAISHKDVICFDSKQFEIKDAYGFSDDFLRKRGKYCQFLFDFDEHIDKTMEPIRKVTYFGKNKKQMESMRMSLLDQYPNLSISSTNIMNIEINCKEATKENGLMFLLKEIHIQPEQCIAFGDGINDIGLLNRVKVGICMLNGRQETKEIADDIALSNDEDGMAIYLENIFNEVK